MVTPRRKAPQKILPQTVDEAVALATRYLELSMSIEQLKADADASIAQIQAARDAMILPVKQDVDRIFSDLRDWWSVAGPEMTKGKRKSIEIGGCIIGERTPPPSLRHPGVTADALIDALERLELDHFLRVKTSLDKPLILSALRSGDDLGDALAALGLKVEQRDEFFIDRAAPAEADPETLTIGDTRHD